MTSSKLQIRIFWHNKTVYENPQIPINLKIFCLKCLVLRIYWRLTTLLFICKSMYILKVHLMHCTLSFRQNKRYEKCPSFLSRAPTHLRLIFNLRFLYDLKYKVCLSKTVCGILHFRFHSVFIKAYVFVQ